MAEELVSLALRPSGNGFPKNPGPTNLYNAAGALRGGAEPYQNGLEWSSEDTQGYTTVLNKWLDPTQWPNVEVWGDSDTLTYASAGGSGWTWAAVKLPQQAIANVTRYELLTLTATCRHTGGSTTKPVFAGLFNGAISIIPWQGKYGVDQSFMDGSLSVTNSTGAVSKFIITLNNLDADGITQLGRIAEWLNAGSCWFGISAREPMNVHEVTLNFDYYAEEPLPEEPVPEEPIPEPVISGQLESRRSRFW